MNKIDYAGALLRRWWLLLVLFCVGALVGILLPLSHASSPKAVNGPVSSWGYRTLALVGAAPYGGGANPALGGGVSTSQIIFYASEASVAVAAAKDVGLHGTSADLAGEVTPFGAIVPTSSSATAKKAAVVTVAGQLWLSALGPTPKLSAAFTNAYAAEIGKTLQNLVSAHYNVQLQQARQSVTTLQNKLNLLTVSKASATSIAQVNNQLAAANTQVQVLEASPPSTGYQILRPAYPSGAYKDATVPTKSGGLGGSHKVRALAGALLGLLIGAGIALMMELLDKRVRTAAGARAAFGFPVVAEIPVPEVVGATNLSLPDHLSMVSAEAYRKLRMSIHLEGLAPVTYAEDHMPNASGYLDPGANGSNQFEPFNGSGVRGDELRQVILIVSPGMESSRSMVVANLAASYAEADQRVVVITAQDLHGPGRHDGRNFVNGQVHSADVKAKLEPTSHRGVALLSLSHFIDHSGQLVTRTPAIIDAVRELADAIVVEAPSQLAYHDAEALTPTADIVLVVGECGETTFDNASKTGEIMRRIGAPVLGVVLTNVPIRSNDVRLQAERAEARLATSTTIKPTAPAAPATQSAPTVPVVPGTRSTSSVPVVATAPAVPATQSTPTAPAAPSVPVDDRGREPVAVGNGDSLPERSGNGNGSKTPEDAGAGNGNGQVHGNGSKTPEGAGAGNGNGNGNGQVVHANGNGNGNGHANGNGNGNGSGQVVHANGNGNGNGQVVPINGNGNENGHANGNGNGDGQVVHANGNGNGNGHANGNGNGQGEPAPDVVPSEVAPPGAKKDS